MCEARERDDAYTRVYGMETRVRGRDDGFLTVHLIANLVRFERGEGRAMILSSTAEVWACSFSSSYLFFSSGWKCGV